MAPVNVNLITIWTMYLQRHAIYILHRMIIPTTFCIDQGKFQGYLNNRRHLQNQEKLGIETELFFVSVEKCILHPLFELIMVQLLHFVFTPFFAFSKLALYSTLNPSSFKEEHLVGIPRIQAIQKKWKTFIPSSFLLLRTK